MSKLPPPRLCVSESELYHYVKHHLDVGQAVHVIGTFVERDDEGQLITQEWDEPFVVTDIWNSAVTLCRIKTGDEWEFDREPIERLKCELKLKPIRSNRVFTVSENPVVLVDGGRMVVGCSILSRRELTSIFRKVGTHLDYDVE